MAAEKKETADLTVLSYIKSSENNQLKESNKNAISKKNISPNDSDLDTKNKNKLGYIDSLDYTSIPEPNQGLKFKIIQKTKENPLVPIGLFATIGALTLGLRTLYTGDSKMSQMMMRLRVGAQGFTLIALLGGVAYQRGGIAKLFITSSSNEKDK